MKASKTTPEQPLHVDARQQGDRLVVLTPDDEDRFVRDCRWVVESSKLGLSRDVWLREFHSLLRHVRAWAVEHGARIRACYATQRDDQIAVFVVPECAKYDFELAELLTALDVELAEKFRACPCDVMQTPEKQFSELEELAQQSLAVLIYARR